MKLSTALFVSAGFAVLAAIMPILLTLIAAATASISGCTGGANDCLIFGIDAFPTLFGMGHFIWLFIFTWLYLPVAIGFVIAGFIVRARGGSDLARNQTVGVVYWLLFFAFVMLPFVQGVPLVMILLAIFLGYWRKRKSKANAEI